MKKIVSALAVLAVVGGALAFKPYNAGSIYCVANTDVLSVNQNLACTDSHQPASTKIDFKVTTVSTDPTTNPCLSDETPFDGSQSGKCIQKTPGSDHFAATAQ